MRSAFVPRPACGPRLKSGKATKLLADSETIALLFAGGIFGTIENAERHILAVGKCAGSDEIARRDLTDKNRKTSCPPFVGARANARTGSALEVAASSWNPALIRCAAQGVFRGIGIRGSCRGVNFSNIAPAAEAVNLNAGISSNGNRR